MSGVVAQSNLLVLVHGRSLKSRNGAGIELVMSNIHAELNGTVKWNVCSVKICQA